MSIPFLNKAYFSTNVGIGLDTSIAQLDVTSATTSSVQNTVLMLKGDSAQDQNDSMTVDMDFYMEDNNTVTGIPQGRIGLVGSGTPSQAYEAAGRLAFYTTTRAYPTPVLTERMRIDGVGNVGIGTTAPLSKLDVNDSAKSAFTGANEMALRIRGDKTTDYYTGLGFSNGDNADSGRIAVKRTTAGSVMTFGTSNVYTSGITNEAMVIDQVGNVGIGTTSPQGTLSVKVGLFRQFDFVEEDSTMTLKSTAPDASYNVRQLALSGSDLKFYTGATSGTTTSERMRIDDTGSIKFNAYDSANNTGTPTYLLGTDASGNVVKTLGTSGDAGNWTLSGTDIYNNNSDQVFIGASSAVASRPEIFQVTGTQIITNTSTGSASLYVGYNSSGSTTLQLGRGRTAAGLAYADFNGEVLSAGDYGLRIIRNSGANPVSEIQHKGTGSLSINSINSGDILFPNGNVGIGTTAPTTILDIDDNASVGTGIRIKGGGSGGSLATFTRDLAAGVDATVSINGNSGYPTIAFDENLGGNKFAIGGHGSSFFITSGTNALGNNDVMFKLSTTGDLTTGNPTTPVGNNSVTMHAGAGNSHNTYRYMGVSGDTQYQYSERTYVVYSTTNWMRWQRLVGGTTWTTQMTLSNHGNLTIPGEFVSQGTGDSSFAGDVGIGTTNPTVPLHVVRNSNSYAVNLADTASRASALFKSTSSHDGAISFTRGTADTQQIQGTNIAGTTARDISLNPFGGDVGIGTEAPTTKLDVVGTGKFSDQVTIPVTPVATTDAASKAYVDAHGGGVGPFLPIANPTFTGTLTGPTITATGDISTSGDLVMSTNASYLYGELASGAGTRIHGINGSNIEYIGSVDQTTSSTIIGLNTGDIRFGNTRATLDSSGNLGIGTTSPTDTLDLRGTFSQRPATDTTAVWQLKSADGGLKARFDLDGGDSALLMRNEADVYTTRIDSNGNSYFTGGNVGIGITTPTSILHIGDTTPILKIVSTSYFNDSFIEMGNGALANSGKISCFNNPGITALELKFDNGAFGDARIRVGQRYLDFGIDSGTAMYINSSKNVGIGTSATSERLAVSGSSDTLLDTLGVYNTGVTGTSALNKGTAVRIGKNVNGDYSTKIATIYENSSPNFLDPALAFYTMSGTYLKGSEVERMRIASNGNVGIGTSAPTYKLDVVGTLRASSVIHGNTSFEANNSNQRVKFAVYNGTSYGTGFGSGYTFGGLNDFAMTFQMSNTSTRGWWWGDTGHSNAQGAMSLTTKGLLNVAGLTRIGYGESSTTAPATYGLDVSGTGRFTSTVTATNFILSSDERLKENIKELQPKNIDAKWKSFNVKDSDEGYRVGVIAQELEVTNPEFVETNDEGFKSVKYIDLLISKIAELEDRIKQLEK